MVLSKQKPSNSSVITSSIPMLFLITLAIFLDLVSLCNSSSSISESDSDSIEVIGLLNAMRPSAQVPEVVSIDEPHSSENRIKYSSNHHKHRLNPTLPENNEIIRANPRHISSSAHNINSNSFDTEAPSSQPACATCGSGQANQQLESTLPERTLRAMRLEMIKRQILKKLRVTEPPRVEDMPRDTKLLPTPIVLGDTLSGKKAAPADRDVEDFYGKTEQVIVFPEEVRPGCLTFTYRNDPSACFLFNIPRKIQPQDISSAELWVYKLPNTNSRRNQSFFVSEVHKTDESNYSSEEDYESLPLVARSKVIGRKWNLRQEMGWMSLNVSAAASGWLRRSVQSVAVTNVTLQIGCKDCGLFAGESPIDPEHERPFLVFNIAGVTPKKRTKRYVDCSPGVSECCRERFRVDFREIGLDHWIIAPPYYDAYYCKGSCISINGMGHSKTGRTTLVQKYLQHHGVNNRTAELVPCCTASKMRSQQLFFRDLDSVNDTIRDETLPNMVIESCGCL